MERRIAAALLFLALGCHPGPARTAFDPAVAAPASPSAHVASPPTATQSRCSSGVISLSELAACSCKPPPPAAEPSQMVDWSGCWGQVAHDESLKDLIHVESRAVPARVAPGADARLEYSFTLRGQAARSIVLRSRAELRRLRSGSSTTELAIGECGSDGSRWDSQALLRLEPDKPLVVTVPFRAERPHGKLVRLTLPDEYDDCEIEQVPLEPGSYEVVPPFSVYDLPRVPPAIIDVTAEPASTPRVVAPRAELDPSEAYGAELPSVCRSGTRTLEELQVCSCQAHQFVLERDGRRLVRAGDYCGPGWYGRDLRSLVRTSLDVSPKVVAPGATATLRYRVESAASVPLPVVLRVDYSRSLRPRLSDGGAVPAGPCAHGGSATRRDLLVVLEPAQPLVLELTVNATVERSALPKERAARRPVCRFWTAPLPVGRYRFAPTFGVVDLPPLPDAELEVAE